MIGLPTIFASLGAIGIVFALLNLMIGLFGAGFDMRWITGNFGVGLVLLIVAAAMNFDAVRARMRSGEAKRVGKYGTSAFVSTVLSIVIIAGLGFLSTRYTHRFDWSEGQVHSLTDQSLKVLENLDQDVEVVAFVQPLEAGPVKQVLERYAYESDRFHLMVVDPNERPELLEKYEISPWQLGNGLIRVAMGEESVNVTELSEENVTNAMVKLSRTGEKKVYFLEGHGERAIDGERAKQRSGYTRAVEALANENYLVEKLLLARHGDVPPDADVIVVAGPTRPLLGGERDALTRFLEQGGALLVLLDPGAKTDLVDDLEDWGVILEDDIIVDRQLALFGKATSPFAARYDTEHAITKDMRETTLYHLARSVRKSEGSNLTEIVFTGASAWAERDLERFYDEGIAELGEDDLPGPVSLAVAGTPTLDSATEDSSEDDESREGAGEPRLVVFGDADFVANERVDSARNRDIFVNSVNWLMGDVEAISIRPQVSKASRFQPTAEQFMRIRSWSLFVVPEAVAIVGVLVWWSRRRAQER